MKRQYARDALRSDRLQDRQSDADRWCRQFWIAGKRPSGIDASTVQLVRDRARSECHPSPHKRKAQGERGDGMNGRIRSREDRRLTSTWRRYHRLAVEKQYRRSRVRTNSLPSAIAGVPTIEDPKSFFASTSKVGPFSITTTNPFSPAT